MIWAILFLLALGALLALLAPVLSARGGETAVADEDYLLAQLDDIERDRAAGHLSEEDAASAVVEAKRRLLDAARTAKAAAAPMQTKWAKSLSVLLVAAVPVAAAAIYFALGNPTLAPTLEPAPSPAAMSEEERAVMIENMVQGLALRLEENPDDLEGWMMLGRSYGVLGRRNEAIGALEKAVALAPNDVAVRRMHAEALLAAREAEGRLIDQATEQALKEIEALQSDDPFALYFLGARPRSDCTLEIGVESHDRLYRNPFQSPLRPDEMKPGLRVEPKSIGEPR